MLVGALARGALVGNSPFRPKSAIPFRAKPLVEKKRLIAKFFVKNDRISKKFFSQLCEFHSFLRLRTMINNDYRDECRSPSSLLRQQRTMHYQGCLITAAETYLESVSTIHSDSIGRINVGDSLRMEAKGEQSI